MADPFAPSADPDIPTPTREDLLPHVHGSVRDMLSANKLDATHAANEWAGARRIWDERHKEAAIKWREQTATLAGSNHMWFGYFYISHLAEKDRDRIKRGEFEPREIEKLAKGEDPWDAHYSVPSDVERDTSLPPFDEWLQSVIEHFAPINEKIRKAAADAANLANATLPPPASKPEEPRGVRVPVQRREHVPTAAERREAELLEFMPKPLRVEYDKADAKRKAALWEANERNFDAAQKREEQRLRQYQEKTEKTLDLLHRIKEDSTKAHLLPPDDASMDDLHKWYDKMRKPVRPVPFAGEGGYSQGAVTNSATPAGEDTREIVQQQRESASPSGPLTAAGMDKLIEEARQKKKASVRFPPPPMEQSRIPIPERPVISTPKTTGFWHDLSKKELAAIIAGVATVLGLFGGFITSALQIAGIIDMAIAHFLIFMSGLVVVAGTAAFLFLWERLSTISILLRVIILAAAGFVTGAGLLLTDSWMINKRAELLRTPTDKGTAPQPTPVIKPPTNQVSPTQSPSPTVGRNLGTTPQPILFPSDVKMGVLQCSVSEYGDEGYRLMQGAICIAKHQQTGQKFTGGTDYQGMVQIHVPYGLYFVTVKADGYITEVGSIKVDQEIVDFGAVLKRVRR